MSIGIELVPSGSDPGQGEALSPGAPTANSPFTFAELCSLQFTLLSQPEQTVATPSLDENFLPQPDEKAGPPAAANAKGVARSDPASSPASSFSSFFPFLPSPVVMPAPEPVTPPPIAPLSLPQAETIPSGHEAAPPNPALPPALNPQSSTNLQTAAETLNSLPLAIPIAEKPAPAAASWASAKSDSISSSVPGPTAQALQPIATASSAEIVNVPPQTSSAIVTTSNATIANATPPASAPIATAWSDAIVKATAVPTCNETAPADPGSQNSVAQGLTAAAPIPQGLMLDAVGCFDNAQSPSLSPDPATPGSPDAAVPVPDPVLPKDSGIATQSVSTPSVPQAVPQSATAPVPPDSPSVASVSASPISTPGGWKAEAAKTHSDAPPNDPSHDVVHPESIGTSSAAATFAVPAVLSVARLSPQTARPVITLHPVNPSSSTPAAPPPSLAQSLPLVQPTFPLASGSGLNRSGENFASPPSTTPAPISIKDSPSGSSSDNSSDAAPRKDQAPAPATSVAAPASSTSSSSASPAFSAAPQPLLATPPATIDAGAPPPATGPTPSAVSSPKPDTHGAAPDSARNLPPEAAQPASGSGPVQAAQILSKAAQSEMRIGLTTNAFGNVEVRTVVRSNDVGIQIGSEKGDLPALLSNDIPGIANTLQRQDLNLAQVNFHQQGFVFSGDASAGGQAQPRWFASRPQPFSASSAEPPIPEAAPAEATSTRTGGLSILA